MMSDYYMKSIIMKFAIESTFLCQPSMVVSDWYAHNWDGSMGKKFVNKKLEYYWAALLL